MAYTKAQLLDAFCRREGYVEGEQTKQQFLQEWLARQKTPVQEAKERALQQLEYEEGLRVRQEADGVDL